jgi:hypothetical protein
MLKLSRHVQQLMRQGVLTSEVASTHPLEDYQRALTQAEAPGKTGKVLLRIASQ